MQVLRPLRDIFPAGDYPDLLIGLGSADDAAVYHLDDDRCLVVTTDFFTPIVDNAYDYGVIAAVNALSDIYAMGAEPVMALNIVAWPEKAGIELLKDVIRGMSETVKSAGAVIAGGHTITDDEPKVGLVVIGFCHPGKLMTKSGARAGDILYLTKPLGSGTITTALKRQIAAEVAVNEAVFWMKKTNRNAALSAVECGVRAATDITGFGFIGHASEMADASDVTLVIDFSMIPVMNSAPGFADEWVFPGGSINNWEAYETLTSIECEITDSRLMLLYDAQTSGGLLISVNDDRAMLFEEKMRSRDAEFWQIGKVTQRDNTPIRII